MSRILVTGGFGFIGSYICRSLVEKGHMLAVVDVLARPPNLNVLLKRRKGWSWRYATVYSEDIRKPNIMLRIFKEFRPEVVVHLAAVSSAVYARRHVRETVETNILGTYNLLRAAKMLHVERFVFVSSSMVYGDFIEEPVSEDHPLEPKEIYGISKLAGERLVRSFMGSPFVIVRPSAVYGPLDSGNRIVQRFVEAAKKGTVSEAWDVDERRLDFTYIEDTVDGIVLATQHPRADYGIFNITRGEGRTIRELIDTIKAYAPDWPLRLINRGAPMVRRGTLDISHARSILRYEPKYSLEDGLAEYWEKV